jgi:hypothetical protein
MARGFFTDRAFKRPTFNKGLGRFYSVYSELEIIQINHKKWASSTIDGVVKSRESSIKPVGWAIAHHNWRAIARPTLFIAIKRLFTSPSLLDVERWMLDVHFLFIA